MPALLSAQRERRVHTRLRVVFDSAIALVHPFFDRANTWSGVWLEHFAQRVLREHYPELTADDIYVFVAAARGIHARSSRRMRPRP